MKLKNTKTRNLIFNYLKNCEEPQSANQIFIALQKEAITLSTIYRSLETFTKESIIQKQTNNDAVAVYFFPKEHHCHFLECKHCHNKIKLSYCPFNTIKQQIEQENNFTLDENNIKIFGLCKQCKDKKD